MSGIICAIRGGPHSQPTIRQAVATAKQHQIPIYFLYVVNLDFMEHTEHSRTQVIQRELREMGEFICLKAQIEAEREGVQANVVVREGNVTDEIVALCHDIQAEFVVLGQPQGKPTTNIFDQERLQEFSQTLETQTEAKVIFSQGE
ncbi:MAG: universal stress protein [Anaerolineales bacterium]